MRIQPVDSSYKTFCDLVSGYRHLAVVMQAVKSGIVDTVGRQPCRAEDLIRSTGMQAEEGQRFLALLVSSGILEECNDLLHLSGFARRYLFTQSDCNQLAVLDFEQLLLQKWSGLGTVLASGQQAAVCDQPPEEYPDRLSLYQRAMHGAALIRAQELWDSLPALAERGVIIDIGAGDGTYLQAFLQRRPQWHAIACDLPAVLAVNKAALDNSAISTHGCDLTAAEELAEFVSRHQGSCCLLLLSNIMHCYSKEENVSLLRRLVELLSADGMLVIHDFFSDGNGFSALYDIHMLVNTYNGRTYSFAETGQMLQSAGLHYSTIFELPSYSHALVASRHDRHGLQRELAGGASRTRNRECSGLAGNGNHLPPGFEPCLSIDCCQEV